MNGLRVVWALTVGTSAILEGLLLDLLSFHLILQWKGMSTYDYILAQREAQETQMDTNAQCESSSQQQQLQQKMSCFRIGRKARVTPSEISLEALTNLPQKKKKLKVRLNPVTAWRVNSKSTSTPVAKTRFSSMAEYMPTMFASKIPEPAAQNQNEPTALPSDVSEQPSARENPVFDLEAQRTSPSQLSASSRLPILLGPSIAWSPTVSDSTSIMSQNAWETPDASHALTPVKHQLSIDNALFVQPLLNS